MRSQKAKQDCDRCGFTFALGDLIKHKGLLVCKACLDDADPKSRVYWGFYGDADAGAKTVTDLSTGVIITKTEEHMLIKGTPGWSYASAPFTAGTTDKERLALEGTDDDSKLYLDRKLFPSTTLSCNVTYRGSFRQCNSDTLSYVWVGLSYGGHDASPFTVRARIYSYDASTGIPLAPYTVLATTNTCTIVGAGGDAFARRWVKLPLTTTLSITSGNYYGALVDTSISAGVMYYVSGTGYKSFSYFGGAPPGSEWQAIMNHDYYVFMGNTDAEFEAWVMGNSNMELWNDTRIELGDGDIIQFVWDATKAKWVETSRSYYYERNVKGSYV